MTILKEHPVYGTESRRETRKERKKERKKERLKKRKFLESCPMILSYQRGVGKKIENRTAGN